MNSNIKIIHTTSCLPQMLWQPIRKMYPFIIHKNVINVGAALLTNQITAYDNNRSCKQFATEYHYQYST